MQNQGYPPYGGGGGGGYQPPPPQPGFMPQDQGYGYPPNDVYNGGGDPEDPNKGFTFDDASIRRGFIRKVYSILMVSYVISLIRVELNNNSPDNDSMPWNFQTFKFDNR